jgi:hypothetical protein
VWVRKSLFGEVQMMTTKTVVNGGKVTGIYMSSWSTELTMSVEGGEILVDLDEKQVLRLRNDCDSRLKRLAASAKEELEKLAASATEEA